MALQKSWGHTHFSQMGRKVQCHLGENSRESALPAVQGLCCTGAHTRTCSHVHAQTHTHFYTHAHTHTHTPAHTHTGGHAQSGLRGWELLVSQYADCFSLLSPWISQQESDVSIVQAQGGLSEALSLGWESPSSQLYWLLRHSPCPPSTQVSPEAEPEPILVQLVMESLLMHHLEDGKGFALLFATVFPGPGTAPGV